MEVNTNDYNKYKLIASRYTPLFTTNKDSFTNIQSIFWNWLDVDRFDILNEYSPFNLITDNSKKHPLPSWKSSTKSLEQIIMETAESQMKQNKKISVLWSGGVDSTCIIASLIMCGINKDNLTILCSNAIHDEAEYEYNILKKWGYNFKPFEFERDILTNLNEDHIISGWCADQLFGSQINQNFPEFEHLPYKDCVRKIAKLSYQCRLLSDYQINKMIELIEYYSSKLNLQINTTSEFLWLFNFGIKWSHVSRDLELSLPNCKTHYNFYESTDFQDWSITNYKYNTSLSQANPKTYKPQLKKMIYKVFKNDDYLKNKCKVGSWKGVTASTNLLDADQALMFKHNDSIHIEMYNMKLPDDIMNNPDITIREKMEKQKLMMRIRSKIFLKNEEDIDKYILLG